MHLDKFETYPSGNLGLSIHRHIATRCGLLSTKSSLRLRTHSTLIDFYFQVRTKTQILHIISSFHSVLCLSLDVHDRVEYVHKYIPLRVHDINIVTQEMGPPIW